MDELRGFNEEKLWRKVFMFIDDDVFENWLKDCDYYIGDVIAAMRKCISVLQIELS